MASRAALLVTTALLGCGARSSLEASDAGAGGGAAGITETCNGLDDDLDGQIDEGLGELSCGLGACRVTVPACDAGVAATCIPGAPGVERCNQVDDDCDGATDEDLGFESVRGPFTVAVGAYYLKTTLVATEPGLLLGTARANDPVGTTLSSIVALPIDLDGQPLAELSKVVEDALDGPTVVPTGDGALLFGTCVRVGTEFGAGSRVTDALGVPLAERVVRSPGDAGCGASWPAAISTGSRQLFSWVGGPTGPNGGYGVWLDVADAAGASVGSRLLVADGDVVNGAPSFARAGDAFGLAFDVRVAADSRPRVWLGVLDAAGDLLGAPRVLEPADDATSFGSPTLVERAQGGFVVLAGDRLAGGLYRAAYGDDGSGPGALARVDGFDHRAVDQISAAARPGGGAVVAAQSHAWPDLDGRGFVAALDDDGGITGEWMSDDPDEVELWGASVAVREGRVFLTYAVLGPEGTELRLRELGCVAAPD